MIKSLPFLFSLMLLASGIKGQKVQESIPVMDIGVDSLISVIHVQANVVCISFGADAVTAIQTKDGIVVIDAGISTGLTLKYRRIIEKEFQCSDFRYVINTHYHPDHYGGNSVFENAEIVGHNNGGKEIDLQMQDSEKLLKNLSRIRDQYEAKIHQYQPYTENWTEAFIQKIRYSAALADIQKGIRFRPPTISFSDSLHLEVGMINFDLRYFGKCHSSSDILIFVPEMKLLFTGDLFYKYGRPGFNDQQSENGKKWHTASVWIEKRIQDIETVISGHGVLLSVEDVRDFTKRMLEN